MFVSSTVKQKNMATSIFVNLPVKDLNRSVEFFTQLGYTFNQQFTDDNATCMVISENIYAMLLVEKFFKSFIRKDIADASKVKESLIALSAGSKADVDGLIEKVINAGGIEVSDPQDQGFMYSRAFEDLDGHHWEIFWMDPSAIQ